MLNKDKGLGHSILTFFVGDSFVYGLSMIAMILRLKIFSIEDYGIYQLAPTLASFISPLILMGYPLSVLLKVPQYESGGRKYLLSGYLKSLIKAIIIINLSVTGIALFFYSLKILPENLNIPLLLLGFYLFPTAFIPLSNNLLLVLRKSRILVIFSLIRLIADAAASIILYLLLKDIYTVIIYTSILNNLILVPQLIYIMRISKSEVSPEDNVSEKINFIKTLKEGISIGKWTIPSSFMWAGYSSVSLWAASLINLKVVAYTGFALKISGAFFVPFARVSDLILQKLVRNTDKESIITELRNYIKRLIPAFNLILSLFIIFIFYFFSYIFDNKYYNGIIYANIILLSYPFILFFYLLKNIPVVYGNILLANIPEYLAFPVFSILIIFLHSFYGGILIPVTILVSRLLLIFLIYLLFREYKAWEISWLPSMLLVLFAALCFASWYFLVGYAIALIIFLKYNNTSINYAVRMISSVLLRKNSRLELT